MFLKSFGFVSFGKEPTENLCKGETKLRKRSDDSCVLRLSEPIGIVTASLTRLLLLKSSQSQLEVKRNDVKHRGSPSEAYLLFF